MQQLVDQGVPLRYAEAIVDLTYPKTRGDTFYRGPVTDDPKSPAVGVYGLWNGLRGDQSPLGGTKVSDDARTIAQFLRLDNRDIGKIVYASGPRDVAVSTVTAATEQAMKAGDYFEPVRVEEDPMLEDRAAELYRSIARTDGAADYLRSLPLPNFNG